MTSRQTAASKAAQPASSNAEHLFSEKLPSPSSAEQPASSVVHSFHALHLAGWQDVLHVLLRNGRKLAVPHSLLQVPNSMFQGQSVFITHKHTMNEVLIDENAVLLDLRLALYDAVTHNPDVICVCSPHMGANDTRTAALMGCLVDELEYLQEKGKARRIVQQYFVAGVIHFDFISNVRRQVIDPRNTFPAMILEFGSLVVAAVSWPALHSRTAQRVLSAYMQEIATDSAGQPVTLVFGGNWIGHMLQVDHLAVKCGCKAVINGSTVLFVPAESLDSRDIRIDTVQCGEPSISVAKTRSVAQPARTHKSSAAQPATEYTLRENTPLYDNFLDAMQGNEAG